MSKIFTITKGLENLGAFRTGGQGSVYKGKRIGEIITAVKLLPTPIHSESTDNKSYNDFINEVEKLKKVNEVPNPNVVKILSSGLSDSGSFPFIEMEYIEGPDLEDLLKPPYDPIFSIKETVKVAEHLSNALSHCHSVNIKHGDIKSNNVKYNAYSGNYVLLDFGLAVMSDEQRRTSMRQAGAIEFMAPEQYEGLMLVESDIYSFGVILYELLSGQVPFPLTDNGETARNVVRISHIEAPLPDILTIRKKNLPGSWSVEKQDQEMLVPQWLLEILNKCLEKDPEKRFRNGIELKEAIIQCSIAGSYFKETRTGPIQTLEQYQKMLIEKENELERFKLNHIRESKRGIILPLPVFFTAALLFLGLLGYAGLNLFPDKAAYAADPVAAQDVNTFISASIVHPDIPKTLMNNISLNIDSLKKAETRKRDHLISSRIKDERQRSVSSDNSKKERRKRKKFLIF